MNTAPYTNPFSSKYQPLERGNIDKELLRLKSIVLQHNEQELANYWNENHDKLARLAQASLDASIENISSALRVNQVKATRLPLIKLCSAIENLASSIHR